MTQQRKPAAKKAPPRIKNYRSAMDIDDILSVIRQSLASHKARRVMFDNDDDGRPIAIMFQMDINGERFTFRLPVRFERLIRVRRVRTAAGVFRGRGAGALSAALCGVAACGGGGGSA